jgi:hypothetical protein
VFFAVCFWGFVLPLFTVSQGLSRSTLLQEEDRKKREELEAIMEENNRKMEEAQRKLVSSKHGSTVKLAFQ